MIKAGSSFNSIRNAIAKEKNLLDFISSRISESIPIVLQTVVFLLRDAEKLYQLSNAST